MSEVLRAGDTAADCVRGALERIRADCLGAIVRIREESLAEAQAIDRALQDGAASRPLAGVPFTAKEVLSVARLETTAASRAFLRHVPAHDAGAITRLRAAGAVLVAKTNCSELALSAWTGNPLFPETRHPRVPGRSPGGSSGGCAAAVAAGYVPLSLGTDYGGSIRFPAACCGIVGMRPSPGRIPSDGQVPAPPPQSPRARYSLVGPIAESADTLATAFAVLAGADRPVARLPARVAHVGSDPAVEHVVGVLREAGARTVPIAPDWLHEARDLFSAIRALDTFDDLRPLAEQLGPAMQAVIANSPTVRDVATITALERHADALRSQADRLLDEHDLLIAPIATCDIPPASGSPVPLRDLGPCRAITLLDLPSVSIAGVQLIGPRGHDEEVLSAALSLAHSAG